jgi:hypothetical protein
MVVVAEVAPLALGFLCTSHAAPAQALGRIIGRYFLQMHFHTPCYFQLEYFPACFSLSLSPEKEK